MTWDSDLLEPKEKFDNSMSICSLNGLLIILCNPTLIEQLRMHTRSSNSRQKKLAWSCNADGPTYVFCEKRTDTIGQSVLLFQAKQFWQFAVQHDDSVHVHSILQSLRCKTCTFKSLECNSHSPFLFSKLNLLVVGASETLACCFADSLKRCNSERQE